MNTLGKCPASCFNEFEDDRMSNLEMFDTFGGIVLNEIIDVNIEQFKSSRDWPHFWN